MNEQEDKQTLKDQLKEEMAKWQTKMDEAKVQIHLGTKEAQEKIEPYVEKLEQELSQAKKQLQQLESDSKSAWQEVQRGLKLSFKSHAAIL